MRERILFVGKGNAMGADIATAFRHLGHDCYFFDQRSGVTYTDVMRKALRLLRPLEALRRWDDRRMNHELVSAARRLHPSIFLVWNGDAITDETIRTIASDGIITVNWFLDLMTHWEIIRRVAPSYQSFFTPDRRVAESLKQIGTSAHILPFAYSKTSDTFPSGPRHYPISFVGSYHPDIWRKREEFLASVIDLGVHVWGPPAWRISKLKNSYHGTARGAAMTDAYRQSKIVIDIPWDHVEADAISIRPYEATAVGACLFYYDIRPEMRSLFMPEREYVPFRTAEELHEKAAYLLHHPAQLDVIARAGYERFMRDHTYEARLSSMISTIRSTV